MLLRRDWKLNRREMKSLVKARDQLLVTVKSQQDYLNQLNATAHQSTQRTIEQQEIARLRAEAQAVIDRVRPAALSSAESYLHDGTFIEGQTALRIALVDNPADDEARFGLGIIQFVLAVENLGEALYEYGVMSEKTNVPFLRLPVPRNDKPAAISYAQLGQILDTFATDLALAEATFAGIKSDNLKLRLRLDKIKFDFAKTGLNQTSLLDLLAKVNGGQFAFQKGNPEFRIHFDRGDVAWLRSYCHLLSAMVDGYRAVDSESVFEEWAKQTFPNVVATARKAAFDSLNGLRLVNTPRLRRMRLHLVAVCELNKESWEHIRKETDNDYEWLAHPGQDDQNGLSLTNPQIDAWLATMTQLEGLLKGDMLVPGDLLRHIHNGHDTRYGLNVKKLFDDPPTYPFSEAMAHIQAKGIDAKYLELQNGKPKPDIMSLMAAFELFDGPFKFVFAARLN